MSDTGTSPGPPSDEAEARRRHAEKMRNARASAIGFQFAISIAIGAFGGNWLDQRFGTGPWLLLAGVVLGSVAAFRDLITLAKQQQDDPQDSEE